MKKTIVLFSVLCLSFLSTSATAKVEKNDYKLETKGTSRALNLPEAADNSPVISLGQVFDLEIGQMVEGYAIVHYKKGYGKPSGKPGNIKPGATNLCYEYIAKGAKWKNVEPWEINPANNNGLDPLFLLNNMEKNISKWEDASNGIIDDGIKNEILGVGALASTTLSTAGISLNYKNEVYFADISAPGAIGVTIAWGVWGGKPADRIIVEWDQIYDDVDFDWSSNGQPGTMDFENIATHELGHAVGMADLYTDACSSETMYGYGSLGETYKQDLNTGDISGINGLY